MKLSYKITLSLFSLSLFIFAGIQIVPKALANALISPPSVSTGSVTATSTQVNMTTGAATTTLTYDSYSTGQPYISNGATLLTFVTASSSAAVLNISFQYSQNGVDWYADDINNLASTTLLSSPTIFRYAANSTTASTTAFAIPLLTPVRFVRAVFTNTGANLSFYSQITAKREITQN